MSQTTNHTLNLKIAEKIKQLRAVNNITLEVFYFDTGIHLARIEQGKTNITISTLKRICDYFDLNLVDFFKNLEP
jgi:transcriptional regulator with XRE-family HTH domain